MHRKTPVDKIKFKEKIVNIPKRISEKFGDRMEKKHTVIEVVFSEECIEVAKEQAKLKAKETNDKDQASNERTYNLKVEKQLEGILGEMAVLGYLESIANSVGLSKIVERYDDIRTDDFKIAKNEYDIKIYLDREYNVEARSSCSYKMALESSLRWLDTIGPYESQMKQQEKLNDFYIRPLFQFKNLLKDTKEKKVSTKDFSFMEELEKDNLTLYLTGGFSKKALIGRESIVEKSMNQNKTKYLAQNIADGQDMKVLEGYFKKKFSDFKANFKEESIENGIEESLNSKKFLNKKV